MVMRVERSGGTRRCEALEESAAVSVLEPRGSLRPGTPRTLWVSAALSGRVGGELSNTSRKIAFTSRRAAILARWSGPIRKNIIGHGMSVPRQHLGGGGGLLQAQGALALFDQPARQHGCRVLLDPFIEKSGNLLSKIGRMTEAREFITLQRSARSREQELPRRFGPGTGQGRLLEVEVSKVMAQ